MKKRHGIGLAALAFGLLSPGTGHAQHPDVQLRGPNGDPLFSYAVGTPYSPKRTCINPANAPVGGCHYMFNDTVEGPLDSTYESHWAEAAKTHWDHEGNLISSTVPYPQHGISSGYHFQMGRDISWGESQREYYGLGAFTSSPGHYGGYCPPSNFQLVPPTVADPADPEALTKYNRSWGKSSYDFANGECAWCHPGGGPLEYDRNGYRYDGTLGAYRTDTAGDGVEYNPERSSLYGDYYIYEPGVGVVDKSLEWQTKGVAEIDCLMCHYAKQYNLQVRNYCLSVEGGGRGPGYAASFGLVGTNGDTNPLFRTTNRGDGGSAGGNPSCDILMPQPVEPGRPYYEMPASWLVKTPKLENCATCHKADNSWKDGVCSTSRTTCAQDADCPTGEVCDNYPDPLNPLNTGPADEPLGYTAFQKYIAPSTFTDSDTDAPNTREYKIARGRAEYGKRAESINDASNPEFHMDSGFVCVDCHYLIGDGVDISTEDYYPVDFPAMLDAEGQEILPARRVYGIDHQIAKGYNAPDGKNLDQLDNTVTCESCHLYAGTAQGHPNVYSGTCSTDPTGLCHEDSDCLFQGTCNQGTTAYLDLTYGADGIAHTADDIREVPIPTHPAFPAIHFDTIDCRTCHIREQNFYRKEIASDFTSTPYPMDGPDGQGGIARNQVLEGAFLCEGGDLNGQACASDSDCQGPIESGVCRQERIHYQPLVTWGCEKRNCSPGEMQLHPVSTMVNWIWKDLESGQPYPRRFPQEAAQLLRQARSGQANAPFSWTLNAPQGSDTALIVNTAQEINDMVQILQGSDLGYGTLDSTAHLAEPVLNAYLTTFRTSHNRSNDYRTLGANGCDECHSSSDPSHPRYSPLSAGFFDRDHLLFEQPLEGNGLELTCDTGDCTAGTKRIQATLEFPCNYGAPVTVDLTEGVAPGQAINNSIGQADVLCYSATALEYLKQNKISPYFVEFWASFTAAQSDTVSMQVDFDGTASECGNYSCDSGTNTCSGGASKGQSCTTDADCRPCEYGWDFNDDGVVDDQTSGAQVTHVYPSTSVYTASMTVTDPITRYSKTASKYVQAKEIETTTEMVTGTGSTDGTLSASIIIAAPDMGAGESLRSIYIDWRDRTQDRLRSAGSYFHTYLRAGTYQVRVRVSTNLENYYYTIPVTVN